MVEYVKSANEIMHRRATDAARALVSCAPEGSIRALFAGGSVGRNEVWAAEADGVLTIYSDLDLYLVLSPGVDADVVRRCAHAVAAAMPREDDGVVFCRGLDAGVYELDDLLAQPVRPGTVDLADRHQWLHGDRSIVASLRAALSGPIARAEALYLLENRAWDALEAGGADARRGSAAAAKVVLDVAAAHLIAEGRFQGTHAARAAALRERAPAKMSAPAQDAVRLAERIRGGGDAARLDASTAAELTAESWCALAPDILSLPTSAPEVLLSARCARGSRVVNARELARVGRRLGLGTARALALAVRFSSLSARAALRTHALVRALHQSGRVGADAVRFHGVYVDGLAASLGHRDGTLDERVRAALRAVS